MPAVTPYTLPLTFTVSIAVLLLLHVPPAVASVNADTEPIQVHIVPVIASGSGFTVITVVI